MNTNHDYILGTLAATGEVMPLLQNDRRRHLSITGQTGTGKTVLLTQLMRADLLGSAGFCFLDPHGDAAKDIAAMTPSIRSPHVIYLDPSDPDFTFSYNPLANILKNERATTAANIVSSFKNIWANSWGPRLEYVLNNSLRLLLDTPDQSLLGIPKLFTDETYRTWLAARCSDPVVRFYWQHEFAVLDNRMKAETISPIQNKIGILLSNPFLRSILCQNSSTLDLANIMNEGKVLIVNLSKGNLGTEPAHLLGALLITGFAQAAEARRTIVEDERRDFTLYVDEFQNFATESFATILSEARKWRLSLVAVNQHISQLPESLRNAVFGNVGSLIVFRSSAQDAAILAAELGIPNPRAVRETNNFQAWARIIRNGSLMEARFLYMNPPPSSGTQFDKVVAYARNRHMRPRALVDAQIEKAFKQNIQQKGSTVRRRRRPDQ